MPLLMTLGRQVWRRPRPHPRNSAHLEMGSMPPPLPRYQMLVPPSLAAVPPESQLHLHKGWDTCGPEGPAPATFTRGDGYRCVLGVQWGVADVRNFKLRRLGHKGNLLKSQHCRA